LDPRSKQIKDLRAASVELGWPRSTSRRLPSTPNCPCCSGISEGPAYTEQALTAVGVELGSPSPRQVWTSCCSRTRKSAVPRRNWGAPEPCPRNWMVCCTPGPRSLPLALPFNEALGRNRQR
jgi:hypothetical protein